MSIQLRACQEEAIAKMHNGCILCGGVGSGKSRTSIAYYFKECGGDWRDGYSPMTNPRDLYIITTAKKRDSYEWEEEFPPFLLLSDSSDSDEAYYKNLRITVDSWNNIKKYQDVYGAFFIFDEQRLVGRGAWVKSFLKIVRKNRWILLSATPADTWSDYIPVFIANGFYKNRTEFNNEHVVWSRFAKFPKIDRYISEARLEHYRDKLLVDIEVEWDINEHHEDVWVKWDITEYKNATRNRWNPYTDMPMMNAAELCYVQRQIVNSDEARQVALLEIFEKHPRIIVFYNYDYELDILRGMCFGDAVVAEWNGHKHEAVPDSESWVYLVQYTAGAEGWNCIKTDTIVFFSQNYSYRILKQSCGRIRRLNTPFKDLYYYHIKSRSGIDLAIGKALREKKKFNERAYAKW